MKRFSLIVAVILLILLAFPAMGKGMYWNGIEFGAGDCISKGGDFSIYTNAAMTTKKFGVLAASGNTTIAGTLAVTGASTLTGATTFGAGYTGTGATLTALGAFSTKGAIVGATTLAITGNSSLASVDVGGTYATGTAVTISATGNIQANGTLTVDGASALTGAVSIAGAATIPVVAVKTITCAAGTTVIDSTYYGKTCFITGAAAQAITLPANGATAGTYMEFVVTGADTSIPTFSTATVDTLITVNDQAADSVTFGTGHRIGACVKFISNGANWIAVNVGSTTMTVAT